MENIVILIARVFLSLFFLWGSYRKIRNWNVTEGMLAAKKIPYSKYVLLTAVLLQILGGISVILGVYPRIGALLLIIYNLPKTFKLHDFWNFEGQEKVRELDHFLKDIAIVGGLLFLMIFGGGKMIV